MSSGVEDQVRFNFINQHMCYLHLQEGLKFEKNGCTPIISLSLLPWWKVSLQDASGFTNTLIINSQIQLLPMKLLCHIYLNHEGFREFSIYITYSCTALWESKHQLQIDRSTSNNPNTNWWFTGANMTQLTLRGEHLQLLSVIVSLLLPWLLAWDHWNWANNWRGDNWWYL